ncbi:MAG TPA: DUF6448 family protein [Vicinamibacterales bacterium]
MNRKSQRFALASAVVLGLAWSPGTASAHCDTLNGPVVAAARLALQKGDVTPVLRWVKAADEAEIRRALEQTLVVRKAGPQAQELADRYFFETLVRIHRQGEGAPYTGLKAETALDPAVEAADKAIEDGSLDRVVQLVTGDIGTGIWRRFARVAEARKHADETVVAGREFVEAYVEYVHYVEDLHLLVTGKAETHDAAPSRTLAGTHDHK